MNIEPEEITELRKMLFTEQPYVPTYVTTGNKYIIHTLLTCNTNTEFPEWMFNKFRR